MRNAANLLFVFATVGCGASAPPTSSDAAAETGDDAATLDTGRTDSTGVDTGVGACPHGSTGTIEGPVGCTVGNYVKQDDPASLCVPATHMRIAASSDLGSDPLILCRAYGPFPPAGYHDYCCQWK
jgi:hypothetical protein